MAESADGRNRWVQHGNTGSYGDPREERQGNEIYWQRCCEKLAVTTENERIMTKKVTETKQNA